MNRSNSKFLTFVNVHYTIKEGEINCEYCSVTQLKMTELRNKVAVVTGASSGIGAGIVKELLKSDMKVVGLARRKDKIEELGKDYEGRLFSLQTNVVVEEDVLNAFSWIAENVGPIYVLVNNAGCNYLSSIEQSETKEFRRVLDTNFLALTNFTREAIKSMKSNNNNGFIININSVHGHYVHYPGSAIYSASKFAVTAFTESTRRELAATGSKIRITSISPGAVESEMSAPYLHLLPYLKPEDIGRAVKYVLLQSSNVNVAELTLRPVGEVI